MSKRGRILILQAGAEELRVACAAPRSDTIVLTDTCTFWSRKKDKEGSCLRDPTVIDALVEHVKAARLGGAEILFVLGGASVTCNILEMPPLSGKALRQAVHLKLGQQLHFPIEDSVVAIRTLDSGTGASSGPVRVQATAAQSSIIDAALDVADRLRLRVKGICAAPDILGAAAAARDTGAEGGRAVLHVDEKGSTLVVLSGGNICVSAEIPVGLADITTALMRPIISGEEVIQLDEEKAARLRQEVGIPDPSEEIASLGVRGDRVLPLLEPFLQKFLKQLTQWLSFAATTTGQSVTYLELVGPGAATRGLAPAFAARTSLKVDASQWLAAPGADRDGSMESQGADLGVATAAARYHQEAPDLVPAQVRRQERLARICRAVALGGPVVAAAMVVFSLVVDRSAREIEDTTPVCHRQLAQMQASVSSLSLESERARKTEELERAFAAFGEASPHWVAVFKELSLLLPTELQATEYAAESTEAGPVLTIRASVVARRGGRSFDEVVRQTLLLLQRSAFFRRVELVSANRESSGATPDSPGSLSVRLDLHASGLKRGA